MIDKFVEIRRFRNIVHAENRHIQVLLSLFDSYDIPIAEDNWAQGIEPSRSVLEACQLALQAERENAEMYDRLLESSREYPDVQTVLIQLQRASQENHLPAFERCVSPECYRQ